MENALEYEQQRSALMCFAKMFALPGSLLGLIIFWGLLPTWITVVGFFVAAALLVIVNVAWCPVATFLYCMLLPCGATDDHLQVLMSVTSEANRVCVYSA